jgi:hypothetical protein
VNGRRRSALGPGRAELVGLLAHRGCPLCGTLAEAEDRWFSWFVIESYTFPEVIAQLRASAGLCPAHTRRLLEAGSPPRVAAQVARLVVAGTLQRLRAPVPRGPCPACRSLEATATNATRVLVVAFGDPAAEAVRSSAALCRPHAIAVLAQAPPATALDAARTTVAQVTAATSASAGPDLLLVTGLDRDRPVRAALRGTLPEDAPTASGSATGTLARLRHRLRIAACPVCLAAGQTERRYVDWLAEETGAATVSPVHEATSLCPGHLGDLAEVAPAAGAAAARLRAPGYGRKPTSA